MDNDDDNKSDTSEFRGSLGIDVDTGDWFSDINVQLDLQLGRDEWETKLPEVEGGRCTFSSNIFSKKL